MSKFFIAAALGLGLLSAGTAAEAATRAPQAGLTAGITQVHYQGGYHRPHYAPPHRHHRHYTPPPPRHHGWNAPHHRPHRQYGWR